MGVSRDASGCWAAVGGCGCGAVRYEVSAPFVSASYCHCTRCQRRTGTAASAQARAAPGSFRVVRGEEHLRAWAPEGGFEKVFCVLCGSGVFSRPSADDWSTVGVRLGTLKAQQHGGRRRRHGERELGRVGVPRGGGPTRAGVEQVDQDVGAEMELGLDCEMPASRRAGTALKRLVQPPGKAEARARVRHSRSRMDVQPAVGDPATMCGGASSTSCSCATANS